MLTASNTLLLMLITASGFCDLKERKIPNRITFTGILIGIIFNIVTGGWSGLLQGIVGLLAGLSIFFLPFAMGGMGAGDVKLMGAIGALMGWRFSVMTAMYSAMVGGIMVLMYLLYTGKLRYTIKKMLYSLIHLLLQFLSSGIQRESLQGAREVFGKRSRIQKNLYSVRSGYRRWAVLVLIAYNMALNIF